MKTQDRTIREEIKEILNNHGIGGKLEENVTNDLLDLLKQPENQEIDISHAVTADMADFNDVVYNRDCIIELQKVVNKLVKKGHYVKKIQTNKQQKRTIW